jgi:hypothetical protein
MEKSDKEEQMPGRPGTIDCAPSLPPGKCDHRLPHEIAATILTAAYEVVVKKLACDRETGK